MINRVHQGDVLEVLRTWPDAFVDCCVTSPPYWGLRDYGVAGQIGLEPTPEEYIGKMVEVFREVRRVLKPEGTAWVNMGDSYNGSGGAGGDYNNGGFKEGQPKYPGRKATNLKPKDLCGIPWMLAFALRADGWWLRQDIIWHKPNPMPESVTDRCTKAHEYVFLLSKSAKYYYDAEAVKEEASSNTFFHGSNTFKSGANGDRNDGERCQTGTNNPNGRNRRSVWTITTESTPEAHFATFPRKLVEPCILAGCPKDGLVLDPFFGSGTTGLVAYDHGRNFIGIELNQEYIKIAERRLSMAIQQLRLF